MAATKTSLSELFEYAQKANLPAPKFQDAITQPSNDGGALTFTVKGQLIHHSAEGVGNSKQAAKHDCARRLLSMVRETPAKKRSAADEEEAESAKRSAPSQDARNGAAVVLLLLDPSTSSRLATSTSGAATTTQLGVTPVKSVGETVAGSDASATSAKSQIDAISRLKERAEHEKLSDEYSFIDHGPQKSPRFLCTLLFDGRQCSASGMSKRETKHAAAEKMLLMLPKPVADATTKTTITTDTAENDARELCETSVGLHPLASTLEEGTKPGSPAIAPVLAALSKADLLDLTRLVGRRPAGDVAIASVSPNSASVLSSTAPIADACLVVASADGAAASPMKHQFKASVADPAPIAEDAPVAIISTAIQQLIGYAGRNKIAAPVYEFTDRGTASVASRFECVVKFLGAECRAVAAAKQAAKHAAASRMVQRWQQLFSPKATTAAAPSIAAAQSTAPMVESSPGNFPADCSADRSHAQGTVTDGELASKISDHVRSSDDPLDDTGEVYYPALLDEHALRIGTRAPVYGTATAVMQDGHTSAGYEMRVDFNGQPQCIGTGRSKLAAKRDAARRMAEAIGLRTDDATAADSSSIEAGALLEDAPRRLRTTLIEMQWPQPIEQSDTLSSVGSESERAVNVNAFQCTIQGEGRLGERVQHTASTSDRNVARAKRICAQKQLNYLHQSGVYERAVARLEADASERERRQEERRAAFEEKRRHVAPSERWQYPFYDDLVFSDKPSVDRLRVGNFDALLSHAEIETLLTDICREHSYHVSESFTSQTLIGDGPDAEATQQKAVLCTIDVTSRPPTKEFGTAAVIQPDTGTCRKAAQRAAWLSVLNHWHLMVGRYEGTLHNI